MALPGGPGPLGNSSLAVDSRSRAHRRGCPAARPQMSACASPTRPMTTTPSQARRGSDAVAPRRCLPAGWSRMLLVVQWGALRRDPACKEDPLRNLRPADGGDRPQAPDHLTLAAEERQAAYRLLQSGTPPAGIVFASKAAPGSQGTGPMVAGNVTGNSAGNPVGHKRKLATLKQWAVFGHMRSILGEDRCAAGRA